MAYTIRQYATKDGKRYEVRYRKPDGSSTGRRGFKRKMDAAMTLDVYADLFDDDLDELSERMGGLLFRGMWAKCGQT